MTEAERLQDIQIAVARIEERLKVLPCDKRGADIATLFDRTTCLKINGAADRAARVGEEQGIRKGVLLAYGAITAVGGGGVAVLLRLLIGNL